MLVEYAGRGHERREIWDQADHLRAQLLDRHRSPTLIIATPHPHTLTRPLGGDERLNIVFSGWVEVIDRMLGRTRSSQGIFHSVPSVNILCISTQM